MTIDENITTWEYKHVLPRHGSHPTYQFISDAQDTSQDAAYELDFLYGITYDVPNKPYTNLFQIRKQGEKAWELWEVTREIVVQAVMKDEINVPAQN